MRTTLDLPDDLMRRVKIRAAEEHKKLKDAITEFIERGLRQDLMEHKKIGAPVRLNGRGPLTNDEIEAAINQGRD